MYHIREREDDIRRAAYYGRLKEAESIIAEAPKKYREWLARLAWPNAWEKSHWRLARRMIGHLSKSELTASNLTKALSYLEGADDRAALTEVNWVLSLLPQQGIYALEMIYNVLESGDMPLLVTALVEVHRRSFDVQDKTVLFKALINGRANTVGALIESMKVKGDCELKSSLSGVLSSALSSQAWRGCYGAAICRVLDELDVDDLNMHDCADIARLGVDHSLITASIIREELGKCCEK